MPITSFSRVLRHRKFVAIGVNKCVFAPMTSCAARYDVIYHDPFAINCQYLKSWGVNSLDICNTKTNSSGGLYDANMVTIFSNISNMLREFAIS